VVLPTTVRVSKAKAELHLSIAYGVHRRAKSNTAPKKEGNQQKPLSSKNTEGDTTINQHPTGNGRVFFPWRSPALSHLKYGGHTKHMIFMKGSK
jgi:hypothetical protein